MNTSLDSFYHLDCLIRDRLRAFSDVSAKHIIYGGDLGGDLALFYMDELYGSTYTIYASLLPCYPKELRNHILERLSLRSSVVYFDGGTSCHPLVHENLVLRGACSGIATTIRRENRETLEVCACFPLGKSLSRYIAYHSHTSQYEYAEIYPWHFKCVVSQDDIRHYCFLMQGLSGSDFRTIVEHVLPSRSLSESWRLHVCESSTFVDAKAFRLRSSWVDRGFPFNSVSKAGDELP